MLREFRIELMLCNTMDGAENMANIHYGILPPFDVNLIVIALTA